MRKKICANSVTEARQGDFRAEPGWGVTGGGVGIITPQHFVVSGAASTRRDRSEQRRLETAGDGEGERTRAASMHWVV